MNYLSKDLEEIIRESFKSMESQVRRVSRNGDRFNFVKAGGVLYLLHELVAFDKGPARSDLGDYKNESNVVSKYFKNNESKIEKYVDDLCVLINSKASEHSGVDFDLASVGKAKIHLDYLETGDVCAKFAIPLKDGVLVNNRWVDIHLYGDRGQTCVLFEDIERYYDSFSSACKAAKDEVKKKYPTVKIVFKGETCLIQTDIKGLNGRLWMNNEIADDPMVSGWVEIENKIYDLRDIIGYKGNDLDEAQKAALEFMIEKSVRFDNYPF